MQSTLHLKSSFLLARSSSVSRNCSDLRTPNSRCSQSCHSRNTFQSRSGRKDFLPVESPRRSLLPLSPKRTEVRLKSLLQCLAYARSTSEPTGVLQCKSTVCGLNGLRPTLRVGALHLKSSTPESFRGSCSCGLFPWGRFASLRFRPKIWHTIFFSPKTNFKIFLKLTTPDPSYGHIGRKRK